jgi:hypothetical protein
VRESPDQQGNHHSSEVAMKLFVLGLVAAVGLYSSAFAGCADVATDAMHRKGMANGDEPSPYMEKLTAGKRAILTSHRAWYRIARCERGHVVVNMERTCAITDMWAEPTCDAEIESAVSR